MGTLVDRFGFSLSFSYYLKELEGSRMPAAACSRVPNTAGFRQDPIRRCKRSRPQAAAERLFPALPLNNGTAIKLSWLKSSRRERGKWSGEVSELSRYQNRYLLSRLE